jgi:hypothetical protein
VTDRLNPIFRPRSVAVIGASGRECLQRLSQLVVDFPEISELDINPLIVHAEGKGARVADVRIALAPVEPSTPA